MSKFTPIYGKASKEWEEAQLRLNPGKLWGMFCDSVVPSSRLTSALSERGWKAILLAEDLFVHDYTRKDFPTEPTWPVKKCAPMIRSHFEPLLWGLKNLGRDRLILSNCVDPGEIDLPDSVPAYCSVPLDIEAFHDACMFLQSEEAMRGPDGRFVDGLAIIEDMMCTFDSSEDWFIVAGYEAGKLLVGTPEVVDAYCEAAGGEDIVRAYYYHWEMVIPTTWIVKTGKPSEYFARLYDLVGWPYPIYPKSAEFSRYGIDWSLMFGDRITSYGATKKPD